MIIKKEDMNKLVMNFPVEEGFVEAVEKFCKESGTDRIFFSYFYFSLLTCLLIGFIVPVDVVVMSKSILQVI